MAKDFSPIDVSNIGGAITMGYFSDLKKDKRSPFQTIKMIGRLDTEDKIYN